MTTQIFDQAKHYLAAHLLGKESIRESRHPWRKAWQFAYLHSLRVEHIAVKLVEAEAASGTVLPTEEVFTLRLAAILHDIARMDCTTGHAALGAQIVAGWLERPEIAAQVSQPELLLDLIAQHSAKDQPDPTLYHGLLKDADTLDEIGAMSIFMCANWVDHASPFFFNHLLEQLKQQELPFCDQSLSRLHTDTGRRYLGSKRSFIENFIAQLELELEEAKLDDVLLRVE